MVNMEIWLIYKYDQKDFVIEIINKKNWNLIKKIFLARIALGDYEITHANYCDTSSVIVINSFFKYFD